MLSPGVDFDLTELSRPPEEAQPVISIEHLRRFIAMYLDGHPADDPLVSPLTTDLAGLPPLLIQAGTGDPVVQEAHRLAEHARRRGVDVRLDLYPVGAHNFHLFWSFLPEAANAISEVGRFVREPLPPAG